jgi:Lon protease-like protein
LVAGLKRVRLGRELAPTKLFREAEVELYEDFYSLDGTTQRPQLQRRLLESFRSFLPKMPEAMEQLEQVLCSDISLGTLTDLIGYTLELDLESKEQLLRQRNVDQRALLLIEHLSSPTSAKLAAPNAKNFPPAFSPN